MTETVRRFPRSTRVAVVAALLGVVSLVSTVAGAAPSKEDVERARARLEAIEDKLSGIQGQLAATQEKLNAATARVERREAAVEQVTAELILTQEQLDRARASYERVLDPPERTGGGRVHDRSRLQHRLPPQRPERR